MITSGVRGVDRGLPSDQPALDGRSRPGCGPDRRPVDLVVDGRVRVRAGSAVCDPAGPCERVLDGAAGRRNIDADQQRWPLGRAEPEWGLVRHDRVQHPDAVHDLTGRPSGGGHVHPDRGVRTGHRRNGRGMDGRRYGRRLRGDLRGCPDHAHRGHRAALRDPPDEPADPGLDRPDPDGRARDGRADLRRHRVPLYRREQLEPRRAADPHRPVRRRADQEPAGRRRDHRGFRFDHADSRGEHLPAVAGPVRARRHQHRANQGVGGLCHAAVDVADVGLDFRPGDDRAPRIDQHARDRQHERQRHGRLRGPER
jgi:hypothetical protein